MQGKTHHEIELARDDNGVTAGVLQQLEDAVTAMKATPGICLALAELELFWENHRKDAPEVHELRLNIRITDQGTPEDRLAAVAAVADWLGVPVQERHGCHIAQRRFGTGQDSVIIEAHFTPDKDATYKALTEASARQEALVGS